MLFNNFNVIVFVWAASVCLYSGSKENKFPQRQILAKMETNDYTPVIMRISIGYFRPDQVDEVTQKLMSSESTLRPAIEKLRGNVAYYVAIDKEKGYMSNVSIWKSLKDAGQMNGLKEMLDLRNEFETLGISFLPITNHELLWSRKNED
jgi:hypothetical protein